MRLIIVILYLILISFSTSAQGTYTGSGSVTQGLGTTTLNNIYPGCTGSRVSAMGTITSSDNKIWTLPADNLFTSASKLPDLYNQCTGVKPASLSAVNLANLPVKVIDNTGDTITAFLLGDNYFELYINGVLVGVDPVPYTPFNSCVVKFKVKYPYTIAVKLIDWEENMGLGSENNNGNLYHAGDGGFIMQCSDGSVTDSTWKAQTFYIAPIENLSSVIEMPDGTRSSATANTAPTCNANCYGIHYTVPTNWQLSSYSDSLWPRAITYTPAVVGVNWPAYMNVSTVWNNAQFIWSSNLILDNYVLTRKTIKGPTYTFTGNGNWTQASNWLNNKMPPTNLPNGSTIVIDPVTGGQCFLNISQHIPSQGSLIVKPGKIFQMAGNLMIQ